MICADYQLTFEQALEQNTLIEHGDGETYTYVSYTYVLSTVSRQVAVAAQARGGFQSGRGGSGVFGTLPCIRWLTNAPSVGWAR